MYFVLVNQYCTSNVYPHSTNYTNFNLTFFTLSSISANAEKHVQRFSSLQLGTEEGLNSLRVFSIATDKSGAIWMATLDGINRFNGRSMKSYQLGTNQNYPMLQEAPPC